MVGTSGAEKSITGNIIIGRKCFERVQCNSSLDCKHSWFKIQGIFCRMTECCGKAEGKVDRQKISVINTPDLSDTKNNEENTDDDLLAQCIAYASPGPHIFLIVIRPDRLTKEDKQTLQKIQTIFGKEVDKYCMVLFTGGDLLKEKPIEEFLKDNKDLQELLTKCDGQYHAFNNKLEDRSQVSELLKKIRNITENNGKNHYTNEMFQETDRVIHKEKQRILRERRTNVQQEELVTKE